MFITYFPDVLVTIKGLTYHLIKIFFAVFLCKYVIYFGNSSYLLLKSRDNNRGGYFYWLNIYLSEYHSAIVLVIIWGWYFKNKIERLKVNQLDIKIDGTGSFYFDGKVFITMMSPGCVDILWMLLYSLRTNFMSLNSLNDSM